jgi:3-dehydroquinate synthase
MSDNIIFSSNPGADLRSYLGTRTYSKTAVLLDNNTAEFCYPEIQNALPPHQTVTVNPGEEFKNLRTCDQIWQSMTDLQLDRHAVLIILGGGVLGDMGGFCASTFKRGIDFILVPTTLLSQVDASIGGKLGIDFNNLKNHIGSFQTPALTVLYSGFLTTLPFHETRSGFAEIIKHVLIADPAMWELLKKNAVKDQPWDVLIKHSVEFKSDVVRKDPKEKGLRKILNAGHTIGHAIEAHLLGTNRKVMHGEAIAAGLITEAYVSVKRKMLSEEKFREIADYILRIYGKLNIQEQDEDPISHLTKQDKKNKENKVLCVLLEEIGRPRFDCEISIGEVKDALAFYRSGHM